MDCPLHQFRRQIRFQDFCEFCACQRRKRKWFFRCLYQESDHICQNIWSIKRRKLGKSNIGTTVPLDLKITIERSETDTDEIHESISNFINFGSVVDVLADDQDYECYLMKVNRKPFVLKKEGRDVLGGTFPAGAEAVEGICYDRCENNPFCINLSLKKRRLLTL